MEQLINILDTQLDFCEDGLVRTFNYHFDDSNEKETIFLEIETTDSMSPSKWSVLYLQLYKVKTFNFEHIYNWLSQGIRILRHRDSWLINFEREPLETSRFYILFESGTFYLEHVKMKLVPI